MSKELGNGFIFVRFGYRYDSPIGAYTLNVKEVSLTGATIDNIEEKKKAIENGEDIKITFTCNKVELVSPDRIMEYAYGKQRQPEIVTCKECANWDTSWKPSTDRKCFYCPVVDYFVDGDFWCKNGERKVKHDG